MQTVLVVVHLMIVLALVGVVLLQRSEGGGLGIGGGSGFMTARGAANALTRTTAILAAAFFVTSLTLSILARYGDRPTDILDRVQQQPAQPGAGTNSGGVLDKLGGAPSAKPAPASSGSASPAPAASPASSAPAGAAAPAGGSVPAGAATPAPSVPAKPAPSQVPTSQ